MLFTTESNKVSWEVMALITDIETSVEGSGPRRHLDSQRCTFDIEILRVNIISHRCELPNLEFGMQHPDLLILYKK